MLEKIHFKKQNHAYVVVSKGRTIDYVFSRLNFSFEKTVRHITTLPLSQPACTLLSGPVKYFFYVR